MPQPFGNAVITASGIKLLNDAQAGECNIEFTRMAVGDGTYSTEEKTRDTLTKMVALKNEKESYNFNSMKKENDNAVILTSNISNYDESEGKALVTEGFYINEIAVFARAAGTEEEVMYSIAVVSGETGDYMPPYNGYNPAQIIQSYIVSVNNATDTQVVIKGGIYALQEDLDDAQKQIETHIKDSDCHVTAEEKEFWNKGGSGASASEIENMLWEGMVAVKCVLSDDSQLVTSEGEEILITKSLF